MVRDTIQLEDAVSTISLEYLREFASEYYIPEYVHPELPGPKDTIVDFSKGKVGVYTKFFEFANFRVPISQLLFDILGHFQIHLSQLSVLGAAKCYTKPLNSVKKWNNRFFLVDERIFLTIVEWLLDAPKDKMPSADSYFVAEWRSHHWTSQVKIRPPMITGWGETKDQVPAVVSQEAPSAENAATTEVVPELNLEKEATAMGPLVNKKAPQERPK
ncbi:hypothetical protein Tco_1085529 [Tanacetum coccineum]